MIKYQKDEFEKIKPVCKPSECDHLEVVRLYVLGSHTGYACLKCKMTSGTNKVFENHSKKDGAEGE